MAAKAHERRDPQVRVVFDHYRHRLADPDGLSGKAALDAVVRAGLLEDDSAKFVAEVTHRQHRIAREFPERTTITLEPVAKPDDLDMCPV